jgi:hypothetical protein
LLQYGEGRDPNPKSNFYIKEAAMQVGKSFTYAFEDKEWLPKFLIGALVAIVPILNITWAGYTTEIIRRVSRNDPVPLSGWDNFGKKFVDGLILFVAAVIYAIPIIILSIIVTVVIAVPAAAQQGNTQNFLTAVGTGVGILLGCLIFLYGLFLSILIPAVQINFARNGFFGSCFQIGHIVTIATGNLGNYVVAWLAYIVASFLISLVVGGISSILGLIPCIGWILAVVISALAAPYIGVVYAYLFGQVGAQTSEVLPA